MAREYPQPDGGAPLTEYQIIPTDPLGKEQTVTTLTTGPANTMDSERILQKLGAYGWFQVLIFSSLAFVYMRGAWPVLGSIFLAADPGHHCKVPNNTSLNESVPGKVGDDGVWSADKCLMYVSGSERNVTQSCKDGWQYGDLFDSTILTEWDLVCDRGYLGDLSTTIYMVGNMCGALFLTPLSDKFGRKKMILYLLWLQAAIGVGTAFANSYLLFTVLRFFIGLLNMPIALTTYVMMTEFFPSNYRALPSVGVNCFWGIGLIFLAIFGYFIRDWMWLQLVISLPNFLTILYYFWMPESIPWLVATKQYEKARRVAMAAAKINKIPPSEMAFMTAKPETGGADSPDIPPRSEEQLVTKESQNHSKKYTILDLFKTPKLRRYTLILLYLWSANSLSYFGILFSTPNLHGNLFLNLGISGAVEIPALFICMWTMQVYGRRRPHIFFLLLCGVVNVTTIFVPEKTESGTDLSPLIITLAMVGKFGITASYSVAYLYSSEIFPTVVRNHAVGLASFFENTGGVAAPLIVYAATSDKMKKLPLVIFGVVTLVGGILCFFLPETHKCPLPETIEDVENFSRKRKFVNNSDLSPSDDIPVDSTHL